MATGPVQPGLYRAVSEGTDDKLSMKEEEEAEEEGSGGGVCVGGEGVRFLLHHLWLTDSVADLSVCGLG